MEPNDSETSEDNVEEIEDDNTWILGNVITFTASSLMGLGCETLPQ